MLKFYVLISVNTALGNEKKLRRLISESFSQGVSLSVLEELVMQIALFAGVPRALNGFRLLEESVRSLDKQARDSLVHEAQEFRESAVANPVELGAQSFEAVYGDMSNDLRKILKTRHDFFESWIIKSAYGEILSRPGLSLLNRELCAVGVLLALELPIQLWGHMKGALRQGALVQDVQNIFTWLHDDGIDVSQTQELLSRLQENS